MKMKAAFIAALIGAAVILSGGELGDDYVTQYRNHVVQPGQTVWSIAGTYMIEQDRTRDIRELCSDIIKYNGLKTADIQPGQCLVIPLEVRKTTKK